METEAAANANYNNMSTMDIDFFDEALLQLLANDDANPSTSHANQNGETYHLHQIKNQQKQKVDATTTTKPIHPHSIVGTVVSCGCETEDCSHSTITTVSTNAMTASGKKRSHGDDDEEQEEDNERQEDGEEKIAVLTDQQKAIGRRYVLHTASMLLLFYFFIVWVLIIFGLHIPIHLPLFFYFSIIVIGIVITTMMYIKRHETPYSTLNFPSKTENETVNMPSDLVNVKRYTLTLSNKTF